MITDKTVLFSHNAFNDLQALVEHKTKRVTLNIYKRLKKCCEEICESGDCKKTPPELERISVYQYSEISFESFRMIYKNNSDEVKIFGIFDSRRNMTDILTKRLLK
jgi:hypothetical protein